MKAKWLLQTGVFDENFDHFQNALKSQGYSYNTFTYPTAFRDPDFDQFPDNDCVIFYGSLNLANQIRKQKPWIPGTYYDSTNFKCSTYYPNGFGQYLFSDFYMFMPLKEVIRLKKHPHFCYSFSGTIFIRPDSGFKEFTGQVVVTDEKQLFGLPEIEALNSCKHFDDNIMCVVSSAKHIEREWRIVIADKKFVTGCQYKHRMELVVTKDCPQEIIKYAEKVASCEWEPCKVYVMDICIGNNGVPGLLELNSFSCSGLYECDISKIVEIVSKVAEQEWKEYQEI